MIRTRMAAAAVPLVVALTLSIFFSISSPARATDPGTPSFTNGLVQDTDGDGIMDRIVMTFDATLNDTAAGANGFDVDGGGSDMHGTCTGESADPDGTSTLVLNFTCTNPRTTPSGMTLTFTSNNNVTGAEGNAPSFEADDDSGLTDDAAPQLRDATYQDIDADGKIDQIIFYFTETVDGGEGGASLSANDLVFTNDGDFNGAAFGSSTTDLLTGMHISVTVPLGTEASVEDTSENSGLIAISTQNGFTLTDFFGGNTNSTLGAQPQLEFYDNAAPRIRIEGAAAPAYKPGNPTSGRVSGILLTFTEAVTSASVLSENDLTITDDGDFDGFGMGSDSTDLITSTVSSRNVFSSVDADVIDTYDDSGTLEVEIAGSFLLVDASENENSTPVTLSVTVDQADPVIHTIEYQDDDGNGRIDTLVLTFSELLAASSNIAAAHFTISNEGDFDGLAFLDDISDLHTTLTDTITVPMGTEATVIDTYDNSGELDLILDGYSVVEQDGSSILPYVVDEPTLVDGASPVIASVSPPEDGSGTKTRAIVITFSEPMYEEFDYGEGAEYYTNIGTGFEANYSEGDSVVTISHDPFECGDEVQIYTNESEIEDALEDGTLLTTGPADGDWLYTVDCTSGSGSSGGSSTSSDTAVVDLISPTATTETTGGATFNVTWDTSGNGIETVKLSLSTNGGITFSTIVDDLNPDTGTYAWTVPNVDTDLAVVKITAQDSGKGSLSTDSSGTFGISPTGSTEEETDEELSEEDAAAGITRDDEGRRVAPSSGTTGTSPFTNTIESVSLVEEGWFVRSYGSSTVYYVESDGTRRPFWDAQTYFTWANSWDELVWVTDATLPTMPLGDVMLPKPGVVLVKISSDARTYAIVEDEDTGASLLRHITSETTASSMYGANWADYIIDLDPTIMGHFDPGTDITSPEVVDTSIMKTRNEIALLIAS